MNHVTGKPDVAAHSHKARSFHMLALENNQSSTVGAVTANACGHNVLDVLYLEPISANLFLAINPD